MTTAPAAGKNLLGIIERANRISAIELLVAAQAVELRGCRQEMGPCMRQILEQIRGCSAPLVEDRPLAGDIEILSGKIAAGEFSAANYR